MRTRVMPIIWGALVLPAILIGCSEQKNSYGERVEKDSRPEWSDMYDAQKHKRLDRARELAKISPAYVKPDRNPDIYKTGIGLNQVALMDKKTGEYIAIQETDRERKLVDYRFHTKSGKLVCIFMTQIVTGSKGTVDDPVNYRVYHVQESLHRTQEVIQARKHISIERLAEFIGSIREYSENPDRYFIVIDAPQAEGERLI